MITADARRDQTFQENIMGLYPLRQTIRLPGKQFATPVAEFISFLGAAEGSSDSVWIFGYSAFIGLQ
jgi:hypothetical protein